MSRFISDKLQKIDLGNDEWVMIPVSFSFETVMKLTKNNDELETSRAMLVECIKEWNIKDDEGNIPELNEENIMRLNIETIMLISQEISRLLTFNNQDKKK